MPTANMIDLSHWNTVESLIPAAAAGIKGVIHKATEGEGAIDEKVAARFWLAQEAGLMWGLYHFLRPGDMSDQIGNFLEASQAAGVLDDDTLLACDFEVADIGLDEVCDFLERLAEESERSPVLYSGSFLKDALGGKPASPDLTKYRLWIPHYGVPAPTLPPGYDDYWAWQYSDQGDTPGVGSPVDLNDCKTFDNWPGRAEPPIFVPARPVRIAAHVPPSSGVVVLINGEIVYQRGAQ